MKKLRQFGSLLFTSLLLLTSAAQSVSAHVSISEFMANPITISDTDGEWLELHNSSSSSINLSGWSLNVGSDSTIFPANTEIAANDYFLICRNNDPTTNGDLVCHYEWPKLILAQTDGVKNIVLKDKTGTEVDSLTYSSGNVQNGQSTVVKQETNELLNDTTNAYSSTDTNINYGTPGAANIEKLEAENFNTHSGVNYMGINVGFRISALTTFTLDYDDTITVSLYQEGESNPFVTNTGTDNLIDLINSGTTQLSTPFIIQNLGYVENGCNGEPCWEFDNRQWTPSDKPAQAVITLTHNGRTYTATNPSLTEPNGWVFESLVPIVNAENFNTHSSDGYKGVNVGFSINNFTEVTAVEVSLYKNDELLVTNTNNDKLLDLINNQNATQLSTPFIIVDGTYREECWNLGDFTWSDETKPTKAVIKVTNIDDEVYVANNENLNEPNGWSFESIAPTPTNLPDNSPTQPESPTDTPSPETPKGSDSTDEDSQHDSLRFEIPVAQLIQNQNNRPQVESDSDEPETSSTATENPAPDSATDQNDDSTADQSDMSYDWPIILLSIAAIAAIGWHLHRRVDAE